MFSTEYTSIQYEEPTLKMNKLKCAYLRVASLQEIRIEGFSMYTHFSGVVTLYTEVSSFQ